MPCCIAAILAVFGPRLVLLGLWLFNPAYMRGLLSNFILLCVGFLFLPWTTLAYAFAFNQFPGAQMLQLDGTGVVIVVVGLILDILSYGGSGYGNRDRIRGYAR